MTTTTKPMQWNPRFVAFATSNGLTPDEQNDVCRRETYADFFAWIGRARRACALATNGVIAGGYTIVDHDAFTAFCHRFAARQAVQS